MTATDIKIEMIRKKHSLTGIAKALDVTPTAILRVRDRKSTSKRIRQAIADAIERPVEEVFPPNKAA